MGAARFVLAPASAARLIMVHQELRAAFSLTIFSAVGLPDGPCPWLRVLQRELPERSRAALLLAAPWGSPRALKRLLSLNLGLCGERRSRDRVFKRVLQRPSPPSFGGAGFVVIARHTQESRRLAEEVAKVGERLCRAVHRASDCPDEIREAAQGGFTAITPEVRAVLMNWAAQRQQPSGLGAGCRGVTRLWRIWDVLHHTGNTDVAGHIAQRFAQADPCGDSRVDRLVQQSLRNICHDAKAAESPLLRQAKRLLRRFSGCSIIVLWTDPVSSAAFTAAFGDSGCGAFVRELREQKADGDHGASLVLHGGADGPQPFETVAALARAEPVVLVAQVRVAWELTPEQTAGLGAVVDCSGGGELPLWTASLPDTLLGRVADGAHFVGICRGEPPGLAEGAMRNAAALGERLPPVGTARGERRPVAAPACEVAAALEGDGPLPHCHPTLQLAKPLALVVGTALEDSDALFRGLEGASLLWWSPTSECGAARVNLVKRPVGDDTPAVLVSQWHAALIEPGGSFSSEASVRRELAALCQIGYKASCVRILFDATSGPAPSEELQGACGAMEVSGAEVVTGDPTAVAEAVLRWAGALYGADCLAHTLDEFTSCKNGPGEAALQVAQQARLSPLTVELLMLNWRVPLLCTPAELLSVIATCAEPDMQGVQELIDRYAPGAEQQADGDWESRPMTGHSMASWRSAGAQQLPSIARTLDFSPALDPGFPMQGGDVYPDAGEGFGLTEPYTPGGAVGFEGSMFGAQSGAGQGAGYGASPDLNFTQQYTQQYTPAALGAAPAGMPSSKRRRMDPAAAAAVVPDMEVLLSQQQRRRHWVPQPRGW
eukprot:TRINITY_DN8794_c2_g1_i2.p1 TRINITY_DN8794_c2_g1~~TRINITY_DN8794_c2_g1_i2.p1  ORF type:complete len:832 (+),score=288.49 TRINITY_DN8794_c2_g1_i2:298-2793(+)